MSSQSACREPAGNRLRDTFEASPACVSGGILGRWSFWGPANLVTVEDRHSRSEDADPFVGTEYA